MLVEQLEAIGERQEGADGDRRHDIGNDHLEERLPLGGPVDLGRLDHVLGHRLESGDVDDHHVADLLPAHQDDQAPEAVLGF